MVTYISFLADDQDRSVFSKTISYVRKPMQCMPNKYSLLQREL